MIKNKTILGAILVAVALALLLWSPVSAGVARLRGGAAQRPA